MGRRIQRRDEAPVHRRPDFQESAPFVYLDMRSRTEHERVAEKVYDDQGTLRGERFTWREKTQFHPYPNLRTRASRPSLLGSGAFRVLDRLGLLVLYALLFLAGVAVTSLFYVWGGWWGAWFGIAGTAGVLMKVAGD